LESSEQDFMQLLPHACGFPIPQASPTGHATAAAHFLGQIFPANTGFEHKQDAREGTPIVHPLAAWISKAARLGRWE
jgi:hypothetical protein